MWAVPDTVFTIGRSRALLNQGLQSMNDTYTFFFSFPFSLFVKSSRQSLASARMLSECHKASRVELDSRFGRDYKQGTYLLPSWAFGVVYNYLQL